MIVTRRISLSLGRLPLQGRIRVDGCTQGVALGLTVSGLSGRAGGVPESNAESVSYVRTPDVLMGVKQPVQLQTQSRTTCSAG
jgi:hypothetical protein